MSSSKPLVKDNDNCETDVSLSMDTETAPASNGACATGCDNCSRPSTWNTAEPSFDIQNVHDTMGNADECQVFDKL